MKIFTFLLLFYSLDLIANVSSLQFETISVSKGLSGRKVKCIAQDKQGYLWFGTNNGLNRYDGYAFKTFKLGPELSGGLSDSHIHCLHVDSEGLLWIGTERGISICDTQNEDFTKSESINDDKNILATTQIRTIYEDSKGFIWLGTQNGLIKYDKETNKIIRYSFQEKSANIQRNIIRAIFEGHEGNIWVGTFDGLYKLNPNTGAYKQFFIRREKDSFLRNNLILQIKKANKATHSLWICTETGLYLMNQKDETFELYQEVRDNGGLSNNVTKCILYYDDTHLLIGTNEGLNLLNLNTRNSIVYLHVPDKSSSICNDEIWDIFQDKTGGIWLATNNGIAKMTNQKDFFHINQLPLIKKPLNKEYVVKNITEDCKGNHWILTNNILIKKSLDGKDKIYEVKENTTLNVCFADRTGTIWVGHNSGLFYLDTKVDQLKSVKITQMPFPLKYVFGITEDRKGHIWANTFDGICEIIPTRQSNTQEILSYTYQLVKMTDLNVNQEVTYLLADKNDNIWFVLRNNGVCKYNINSGKIQKYSYSKENPTLLSNNVLSIFRDNQYNIFILTDKGLCNYNLTTDSFNHIAISYETDQSLQGSGIDKQGNIWLNTYFQLISYNPKKQSISHYDLTNRLDQHGFVAYSLMTNSQGEILIGGYNKYYSIIPSKVDFHKMPCDLRISEIKVFDKTVAWGLQNDEQIELTHNENYVKFHFALLNYLSDSSNKYYYKLEGVDNRWQSTTGVQNYTSYSNLAPGNYRFVVRSTYTTIEQEASVYIRILPPWWKSTWAWIAYALCGMMVILLFYKNLMSRVRLSKALRLRKMEADKIEEITQIKLRFFANITHEFRTPLTLIMGPIDDLRNRMNENDICQQQLSIMQSNAERLLKLVNQIMDFRKIENKSMSLQLCSGEIVSFLRSTFIMFTIQAQKQNINYSMNTKVESLYMDFDKDKTEKIFYNLLSNAFKFTPPWGNIIVSVDRIVKEDKYFLEIRVADTGIGIPPKERISIFQRFYQVPSQTESGTGIGLALTKEFVELHSGSIFVMEEEREGSTFVVHLPIGSQNESLGLITEPQNQEIQQTQERLLLVDDNDEILRYFQISLSDEYELYFASNGEEGLACAKKVMPDIIITDWMMPVMDGLEFCKIIKSERETSHIPIILLTAKINSTYEGLLQGADDFIIKPFDMKLLKLRIEKLIENRKKLQEYYRLQLLAEPDKIEPFSENEQLLSLIVKSIENKIDDFDLDVKTLCEEIGLSHQQVYRKVKALTGQSINDFIRTIRLKRAAQLLLESDMNISEVMFSVGFSNRSYFSKCFQDQYSLSPTDYRKKRETAI